MKRLLALLLTLSLLLPVLAVADGAMTDKTINFAEFTFGDTYGNIRKNIKVGSIDCEYGAYISRYLADAIDNLPEYSSRDENTAPCFKVREDGQRTVAGYRAGAYLWFAYPDNDLTADNSAIFYCGEYQFDSYGETDVLTIFTDLKGKLSQVYGTPYYDGANITDALGDAMVEDPNRYNENTELYQAQYAVWKSSANNATVVLKYFKQHGDWERTFLMYISDIADATLSQYISAPGAGNTSLEGL